MIGNAFVPHGGGGDDQVPDGDIFSQHTRAAANDEFIESMGNQLFQEGSRTSRTDVSQG